MREEGKQILRLLAEGKIDAEQAFRLLRALGEVPGDERRPEPPREPGAPPDLRGRILRIQVVSAGKSKVNIAVPLTIARMGKAKMAASGIVSGALAKFGIDLDEVLKTVERQGPIVDISDNEDRVLILVE
ncbi:MAG TPA: hypothetical protein VFM93_05975 [Candidatus Limnocylindria bacterium]|nr:hypothetical protein [Candidatus Limnocylindria bacterium]